MPEIVCNTTPLQYLHQADVLGIIPALYGGILVPKAVADEMQCRLECRSQPAGSGSLEWIEVREVIGSTWPMPRDIHRGEAEVIAFGES